MLGARNNNSRIDSQDHSSLTMGSLCAVEPHWLIVHDGHIESSHDAACAAVEGDEARVYAAVGKRLTRGLLGGLRNGVVAGTELELQDVTGLCDDGVGCEG